jgi:nicotinate phosphoribosyltransferase
MRSHPDSNQTIIMGPDRANVISHGIVGGRKTAAKVKSGEMKVKGVRIDSVDIAALPKKVRSPLPEAAIFASGDIDEAEILRLKALGATIDG